jgi:hypothetical protein
MNDIRIKHAEAWDKLHMFVTQRNKLLRDLGKRANFAAELTPATGMYGEFDTDHARDILARLDAMSFELNAALDELNGYAAKIGKPIIERKSIHKDGST